MRQLRRCYPAVTATSAVVRSLVGCGSGRRATLGVRNLNKITDFLFYP